MPKLKKIRIPININERDTYALVDPDNKTIATFRLKQAARSVQGYYERRLWCKLSIVTIK